LQRKLIKLLICEASNFCTRILYNTALNSSVRVMDKVGYEKGQGQ